MITAQEQEHIAELLYEAGMYKSLYDNAAIRIEVLERALRTIRDDGKNCVDHCRRQADKALRMSARDALDKDAANSEKPKND